MNELYNSILKYLNDLPNNRNIYKTDRIPFAEHQDCDIDIRLLGLTGLNPYARHNSSPRAAMFTKHIGQMLVISDPEPRRIQSGIDREFGRYTHSIKFDTNSTVLRVIPQYPSVLRNSNIRYNPLTTVIYEDADSDIQEVCVKQIPGYHTLHPQFGFNYKQNKRFSDYIREGSNIGAGTIVANSPNIDDDGNYRFGVNAKVAYTSQVGGIEDGIVVSESFLEKLKINVYEDRTIQFGTKQLPLNMYGNESHFKIIPDVGERIRGDGVLAVLRDFDVELAPADLSVEAMQEPNTFDEYIYGYPGAEVVNIRITHNPSKDDIMLTNMEEQLEKYLNAQTRYYNEIVKEYNRLRRETNGKVRISNELHRLVADAMAMTDQKNRLKYNDKNNKLDCWAITITFRYQLKADIGFKLTDMSGGKGVICGVKPDHEMLLDADGNRADIEMDADSVAKRMNLAKLYEQYVNAAGSATQKRLKKLIEHDNSPKGYQVAFEYALGFYKLTSPFTYNMIEEARLDPKEHVDELIKNGFYLSVPPDNPINHIDMIRLLKEHYPACYGPCTYIGQTGKQITTKTPILIGEVYFILLDKIANDFSSVSSAKLQHYGLPAKPTKRNKYSGPSRNSPTRTAGESEVRLFVNVAGGEATAELLDRSTNPLVHQEIVKGILNAEYPSNADNYVDRSKYRVGNGTVLNLTRHILACGGVKFMRGDISDDTKYNRY